MKRAFTLIELLIVVAIIAILAAIAVPNFLEAQVRSKVSRAKSDMRSMTTGLESYAVDYTQYPLCNNYTLPGARVSPDEISNATTNFQRRVLERLSTPVAYLTSGFLPDVFTPQERRSSFSSGAPQGSATSLLGDANYKLAQYIKYVALNPTSTGGYADVEQRDGPAKAFVLQCAGPTRAYCNMGDIFATSQTYDVVIGQFYDPTNGTVSYGYIFRIGGTGLDEAGYAGKFMALAPKATNR